MIQRARLLALLLSSHALLASAQNTPPAESAHTQRGGTRAVAQIVELNGLITAVDAPKRMVSIAGATGQNYQVEVGSDVKNFDQIKVGDVVTVKMIEAVVLGLKKSNSGFRERSEKVDVAKAEKGRKPAAEIVRRVTVVADVTEIDASQQKITLRGPKAVIQLAVNDPALLKPIKVGDQVEATYLVGTAVSVAPGK